MKQSAEPNEPHEDERSPHAPDLVPLAERAAEPTAEVEPVAEPVAEPVTQDEPVSEPAPIAQVEPVAEPVAQVEPVAEPAPVAEPEPVARTAPLPEVEPLVDDEAGVILEDGWDGANLVESTYGALTEGFEEREARLRESSSEAVGWAPYIAAVRAFREGRVAGDWESLARLLVAPGSLTSGDDVQIVETRDEDAAVRAAVQESLDAGQRALLLAPDQERAAELLRSMRDDVFALLIETRPATPPAEPDGPTPRGEFGSNGTVEFRPLSFDDEGALDMTLPDLPNPAEPPREPEEWVRDAVVRPVGEAWRQSWETEARLLKRGLMWLEQWPRDAAALRAVQDENTRRRAELEAELAALTKEIEDAGAAEAAAEQGAVDAEAAAERLITVQDEAEAELAGPKAEAERRQAVADAAAADASDRTRDADAAQARCAELHARDTTAQAELQAARDLEASLTDELERAKEALPGVAAEAERLTAADADASGEGHAAYYRLVSAESALSAMKRKMTLGQRMHVASPPSGLSGMRAEVKARAREADEAARRAQEAKDAAEKAGRRHQELAAFVSDGGTRLAHAREAQERLGTELIWLASERESAAAAYQEQARLAAESVDKATQMSMEARVAQQAARAIEERVEAARVAREEALATVGRAKAAAEAAATHAVETRSALERRTAEAERELASRERDLETAVEAEARSRENVREICGADPVGDPELISTHQTRAMARIERLTAYLDGGAAADGAAEGLLRTADLVVGTPLGAGLTAAEEEFDTLIVADAGRLTDAELLVGAVRARRWILVGGAGPEEEDSPFARARAASLTWG
ncbi:hypothetical protein [Actinomadura litoris]|uniref:Uncharacterized protein n=1 Tax=Actinomadura litoris TaxID=2678616 RepID=A0A7K1L9W0_9ACTN|nr:hypothetical protein [Actinomadura litoris]MUN41026.1 hypothetical protein [Actinomadura litoris]